MLIKANKVLEGVKAMNDIRLSYKMALKLEMYMEKEIEKISQDFQDLSWNYNETCKYKEDMKEGKRSFHTDYGIDKASYNDRVKNLRIRQYELYLELENLIKDCKEQNGGKPCLPYSIHLKRQLICFNPSYDNVVEELSKLKEMEEES